MKLIKLNATTSTNFYLKELSVSEALENFSVVVAKLQSKGKGQLNSSWQSERGKNLTFSVFVRLSNVGIIDQFYLSKVVSIAVVKVLSEVVNVPVMIKWPNDILAGGLKIAGILIENRVKKAKLSESVIGIGLNVNQAEFQNLPKATSLIRIANLEFDLDSLLEKIVISLKDCIALLEKREFETIDQMYFKHLFRLNNPAMYKDKVGGLFMGKIVNVSKTGKLQMELEDDTQKEFDLKEVEFIL
ncbi:MAG: biotin--[acetyl-CoA-carboxylase] ligase [Flavobacteriaceae bacterium]|nr:biotin--[acetyl-CoA-carboxylase] ligase [Flavobacteriaceae bacterium]